MDTTRVKGKRSLDDLDETASEAKTNEKMTSGVGLKRPRYESRFLLLPSGRS